jgi:hypothetical protein
MVAAASTILVRVNWRCLNQVFHVRRIFNSHSSHVWPEANPHAVSVQYHQQRLAVKFWAGIVHDFLIGPHLLNPTAQGTDLPGVCGGKAT